MSAPIGPGDWVECIDAGPRMVAGFPFPLAPDNLTKGAVYQVEDVAFEPAWPELPGLLLVGLRAKNRRGTFAPERFRPIYSPKAELIADLLTTIPAEPERIGVEA